MRLCMFHPTDQPMERGWVGKIDGDRVIQLAAQTLQSLFTGGGSAREHAVYPLTGVRLVAPVLHPPAVRVFEDQESFAFANPSAIVGPGVELSIDRRLAVLPRIAAVVGAEGALAGFTCFAEWRAPELSEPKDRDFALGLGPVFVTPDELDPGGLEAVVSVDGSERIRGVLPGFDWDAARDLAASGTVLRPGDLLAGPALGAVEGIAPGSSVELDVDGIGTLAATVAGD